VAAEVVEVIKQMTMEKKITRNITFAVNGVLRLANSFAVEENSLFRFNIDAEIASLLESGSRWKLMFCSEISPPSKLETCSACRLA
jgi:hypothetical protein